LALAALALVALALVVFGAYDSYPSSLPKRANRTDLFLFFKGFFLAL